MVMLQQYVANLKQENLNLQEKTRKDSRILKSIVNKISSLIDGFVWQSKKWRNQKIITPKKFPTRVSVHLVRQESISQMPALIVYIVLAEIMTGESMLYHNSLLHYVFQEIKKLKNRVHLDLTKASLNLLKILSNVGFVYADINCRLKVHFSNNNESFLDSMNDLISKKKCFCDNNFGKEMFSW